jgi:hypothetical protein
VTEVGTREPPPDVGMHPTNGLKLGDRGDVPTYAPRKVTEREVVMPGLTGLPSLPKKLTSIARWLRRASRPPTIWPRGHVSCHEAWGRDDPAAVGTTTHGPAIGMHTWSPSHSFALPAGVTSVSAAAMVATTIATYTTGRLTEPS